MAAKRMMLASHKPSGDWRLGRFARPLRLALWLAVLAIPASGCSSLSETWDSTKESVGKVFAKDDTFVEEPAEKLYNQGLYLMNEKSDPKGASKKFEEVDRQHPYSDLARKSLSLIHI